MTWGPLPQGSICYEQLRVVDDMNDLGSHDLRALDAMDSLGLWMTRITPGCELKALNAMNKSGLWMI